MGSRPRPVNEERERSLNELARCFARAAVGRFIREQDTALAKREAEGSEPGADQGAGTRGTRP